MILNIHTTSVEQVCGQARNPLLSIQRKFLRNCSDEYKTRTKELCADEAQQREQWVLESNNEAVGLMGQVFSLPRLEPLLQDH